MRKHFLFLTVLQILFSQCLSASHSFYIGAVLSQNAISGKRSDSVTNITPTPAILTHNKGVHTKAAYGGMVAGYLFRTENFGIGPEFFYNYGKLENTIRGSHVDTLLGPVNTAFDITHKVTNQYGANVRLGFFLDSYFLYALLGIHSQTSQFYAKARQVDQGTGDVHEHDYRTKKKTKNAFSFGLGAQKAIAENYAIGLECKFARLPKKNFIWNLQDDALVQTKLTSSLKYQMRSISLKLMYIF
jgi:opacity protein-like surface antigen